MPKKDKIGILMIHGFTACPEQFNELADFFSSKGFLVRAPLIAGHGGTPEYLEKSSSDDWKNSVREAYLALKEEAEKIFIIGNSFGGNLAFWLTREFDNEPAGVITLGAPIWLKYQNFILLRLNTYGILRKYYTKPKRVYKNIIAFLACFFIKKNAEFTWAPIIKNREHEVIPTRSFRYFLQFIKNDTKPNLNQIKTPVFIVHSLVDTVVEPRSADFIYENVSSRNKTIYWFPSNYHIVTQDEKRLKLFKKIFSFINGLS